ncbi:MAG: hypothetical protein E7505_05490 [Ruminococcus sp.]|nr:hypothetical protein [Ruminococcus sp.]
MLKKHKIAIITIPIICLVSVIAIYRAHTVNSIHYGEKTRNCVYSISRKMHNLVYDEDFYSRIDGDFVISTWEKYSDDTEISEEIKEELNKRISNDSDKKRYNIEKYEYYIEVKDKKIQIVACSRYKYFSYVAAVSGSRILESRDFSEFVEKRYSDFKNSR